MEANVLFRCKVPTYQDSPGRIVLTDVARNTQLATGSLAVQEGYELAVPSGAQNDGIDGGLTERFDGAQGTNQAQADRFIVRKR
jgi:hypothetical protein